jgi:hypothetical protein
MIVTTEAKIKFPAEPYYDLKAGRPNKRFNRMKRWNQAKKQILSAPDLSQRLTSFTGSVLFFGTSGAGGTSLLKELETVLPRAKYHRAWREPSVRVNLPKAWRHDIVLLDGFEIGKRLDGPLGHVVPFPNLPRQCYGFTSGYSLTHALLGWSEVIKGSPDLIFQKISSGRIIERSYDEIGRSSHV